MSDNLEAHALEGFMQSFHAGHIYHFCNAAQDQFQSHEVGDSECCLRTKASLDCHLLAFVQGHQSHSAVGVKGNCVLNESLQHFHTTTGFTPNISHNIFKGIVPVEFALCIQEMIRLKYVTLEELNRKIRSFAYENLGKVNRPQPISNTYARKQSIGGNGHENSTLLGHS